MEHTQGPLQINHSDPFQICDADGEVRGCAPVAQMVGTASEKRANARRLVACWNAADGIETAHLEQLGLLAVRMESALVEHLKAQRDELLAGLKCAAASFEARCAFGDADDCRALIAKHSNKEVALLAEQAPIGLTDEQLRDEVKRRVESSGLTQENYAMGHGYSPQYLSDFLNGKRKPGPAILEGENMACVTRYVNLNCVPIGPEMLRSAPLAKEASHG